MRSSALLAALVAPLLLVVPLQAQSPVPSAAIAEAAALRDAGRFAEAAERFEAIVRSNPGLPGPRFQLAYCVHASGDHERAVELHRTAARWPQVQVAARYNLACALAMLGRGDEALDALSDAVDAGFADPASARADAELVSIRDDPRFEEVLGYVGQPIASALDFWVGDWDVYTASTRTLNGHNRLEARLGGRVVHEQWRPAAGTGGGTGESWSYFDAASSRWKQNWMPEKGPAVELVGRRKGAGILFEREAHDGRGGTAVTRMFVRPVPAPEGERRVRQTSTVSIDGGATWSPKYDLLYVPAGSALQ